MCLSEVDSKKVNPSLCSSFLETSAEASPPGQVKGTQHMCLYTSHTHSENVIFMSFSHPTASVVSATSSKTPRKTVSPSPLPP